jgi:hypothetical protein
MRLEPDPCRQTRPVGGLTDWVQVPSVPETMCIPLHTGPASGPSTACNHLCLSPSGGRRPENPSRGEYRIARIRSRGHRSRTTPSALSTVAMPYRVVQ